MSNPSSARNYRDASHPQHYSQQRGDNNNTQLSRRSNNYPPGNVNRGRRGAASNSYRGGTQSDAGTGGKFNTKVMILFFEKEVFT